jgi:hypothetical protein
MNRILHLQKLSMSRDSGSLGFDSTCSYLNCDKCSTYSNTGCVKPVDTQVDAG